MDASKLKHPDKQRLDIAEGTALEIGAALQQIGIDVGATECTDTIYVFRSNLPKDSPLGIEWYFVAEPEEYAHAALEISFVHPGSNDEETIFRFGWTEDDGYFVELDTAGLRTPPLPKAVTLVEGFGLVRKGDRKLVPAGEEGVVLAKITDYLKSRTHV